MSRLPVILFFIATALLRAEQSGPRFTDVFVGGRDGYHTYRIPSLLVTKQGSLLAFCEGRKVNHDDNGDIDLLLKRSEDGGKTWSLQQVIWDDSTNTCGNPTPVLDHDTGTIWLFMTHNPGNVNVKVLKTVNSGFSRTVWVCKSEDDGHTWSKPVDLTATLKKPDWVWYATGPGIGIQLQRGSYKGRLVIPACHSQPGKDKARANIIYSDDYGESWQLGGIVSAGVSESQVVELSDGRLLMNSRSLQGNRRSHSISKDGGLTWSAPERQEQLIEPVCQGSIVRHSWPEEGQKSRILFSNPANEQRRRNMTVRLSYDEGNTWPVSKTIYPEWSAYSCLNVLPDQSVACFFEGGDNRANEKIIFVRFTLDRLSTPESQASRHNVLFIAVDDLRTNLGCYGDKTAVTPNIDRLAQSGLVFERAYCQQAVCNPSRQSLLTGRRPDSIRVWNLADHFRNTVPDLVTLPEHFKNNGYFAQSFGKIYHGDKEVNDAQSWSVPEQFAFATKIEDYGEKPDTKAPKKNKAKLSAAKIADNKDDDYPDGKVANAAVEALRKFKSSGTNFFLAVGFRKPHLPFSAPKKYWDLYQRERIPSPHPAAPPANVPAIALHDWVELRGYSDIPEEGPLTAEKIQELRHGYYAATSFMDAQVGKVLDELARLDLDRNTIVVLWSDHGFHLGELGLWCKASNFELDARVPLIVRIPQQKTAGEKTRGLVELVDLYPTLVELCGIPPQAGLDGKSFAPLLQDPKQPGKEAVFTQFPRPWELKKAPQNMGYSVRTANFRYVEWRNVASGEIVGRELYDFSRTNHESVNLAGDRQYQAELSRHSLLVQNLRTNPR